MSMIEFSDQILEEFTVDELIGVVKWLKITTNSDMPDIAEKLDEYRDLGLGEVSVKSCMETVIL